MRVDFGQVHLRPTPAALLMVARPRIFALRGLGNCYTDAVNSGLPASADCIAQVFGGAAYQQSPGSLLPASTEQLASNPVFAGAGPMGGPSQIETLDSFMAAWAAEAATSPTSMQGQDPVSVALGVAQSYCATENPPDCAQMQTIATKYGQQVASAIGQASTIDAQRAAQIIYPSAIPSSSGAMAPPVPASAPVIAPAGAPSGSAGPAMTPRIQSGAGPSGVLSNVMPGAAVGPGGATIIMMPGGAGAGADAGTGGNPFASVPNWVWFAAGGLVLLKVLKVF